MSTTYRKGLTGVVLSIVLGLICCCVVACGSGANGGDTTPPVISNVNVFGITQTSAQISWETDELARSSIIWATTSKLSKEANTDGHDEITISHRFEIIDLLPSTLYFYWPASADEKGNWNVSSEPSTFTTQGD